MQIAMRRCDAAATLLAGFLACAPVVALTAEDTALYWSLERSGEPAGFLLGTIHSEDPRVIDFPESFIGQLSSNRFFAMEMVPDLPTLQRLTEYMRYQDGTTLAESLGAERFARVRAALSAYEVPLEWISTMKIWAVVMTLSVPPPETGLFMDFSLSLRAAGAGLKVVGLETLEQQLAFLEEMPVDKQLALLDQTLAELGRVSEVHEKMVESYLAGNLEALGDQVEEQLSELDASARDYFMSQGIKARNRRMLDSLLPLLATGSVFVAVGALHLPGDGGLIELLRAEGYDLKPLPLPFSAAQGGAQADQRGDQDTGDTP